jgi:hypothetical protein
LAPDVHRTVPKEDLTMTCPQCHPVQELAYLAVSRSLVCLTCGWERPLDEEEIYELFFTRARRIRPAAAAGPLATVTPG